MIMPSMVTVVPTIASENQQLTEDRLPALKVFMLGNLQ